MSEKRRLIRKNANIVLKISDHNTGSHLGQVVNITAEGLLLISEEPIAVDSIFQMDLHLAEPIDEIETVTFGATALWSNLARQAGSYWTGFHIIDISPETTSTIEQVIKNWNADGCDSEETAS